MNIPKKVVGALLPVIAGSAIAAAPNPATTTFQVSITIAKSCTVATGGNVSLGTVDETSPDATGVTNITVACSKTTPYTVALSPSNTSLVGTGSMAGTGGNTDTVNYSLYQDAANAVIWGDTPGTNTIAGTGTGATQPIGTVHVKVLATEFSKTPDTYMDTVTVKVRY